MSSINACYVCEEPLNEANSTLEHIIQQAIGGHLKSKKLICRNCNIAFGNTVDTALTDQLKLLSNMLDIKRDDGENPKAAQTSDGDYYLQPKDGFVRRQPLIKPQIDVEELGERKINLYVNAAVSSQQTRDVIKGIERKLKRHNVPDDKIAEVLAETKMKITTHYESSTSSLGFTAGGDAFRAITKIAVNFYIHSGGEPTSIKHLIPYIKCGVQTNCINLHYPENSIIPKEDGEVLHSIIVIGDAKEKLLYAYVELFNFYRCAVLLNAEYENSSFCKSYFYDVLTSSEVSKNYCINFTKEQLTQLVASNERPSYKFDEELKKILKFGKSMVDKRVQNLLIDEAYSASIGNDYDGQPITEEMLRSFHEKCNDKLIPYLISRISIKS